MANLKLKLDTSALASMLKEYAKEIEADVTESVAALANHTKQRVVDEAKEKLSSPNYKKFVPNVGIDSIAPGVWVVSIKEEVLWIEEGIDPNFDMKPGLLKGKKSVVIPFKHDKTASNRSPRETGLLNEIKARLKSSGLSTKLEKDSAGKAIHGGIDAQGKGIPKLMHKVNFGGEGVTMNWLHKKNEIHPLRGINIYQTLDTKTGNVRRDIMTFRTVSSGPSSAGKWIHPGYEGKKFLDEAAEWAEKEWEQTILPAIVSKWSK